MTETSRETGPLRTRALTFPAVHDLPRLWVLLFVTRHAAILGLGVGALVLPGFGDERFVAGALLLGVVLPYELGVHAYTRRYRRLPSSMPFVYAPVPALFALAFPEVWVVALVAALGNVTLFAITYEMWVALTSMVLSAASFVAVAVVVDPPTAALGLLSFGLVAPAMVLGVGGLLEAFRHTDRRYRDYVERATDILYTHDLETLRFLDVNQAGLDLTGYTRDEIDSITVADVVAPDHLRDVAHRVERALHSDAPPTPWQVDILTKDGRRVPLEVNTRIVRRRGQPVAIQGIARDISERRQVEAQRAALDRARSEFIANAAHELRTPLTTLAGLASVLVSTRHEIDDAELEDALEALARQGRRAQLLADRLLDLSSIELGPVDLKVEAVSVASVVDHALEKAPPSSETTVETSIPDDLRIATDPLRLEQVISNLLVNAYRYGGPHVRVGAADRGDDVVIEVVDDGPGVPDELSDHLFEPFTRGDHGASPDSTGLGLAISASLVEALGGRISYEPAGPGARFRIEMVTGEARDTTQPASPPS